jgi:hypothetical protein
MRTRATTSSTSTTTGTNASATADGATAFTDRETRLTFFSSQGQKTKKHNNHSVRDGAYDVPSFHDD